MNVQRPPPRKSPRQLRAARTVETVLEAVIQILDAHGFDGLTTTRVAQRSGFAVGTIYQYFENKQALVDATVSRQLDRIVAYIRNACEDLQRCNPDDMVAGLAQAFVTANAERPREVHAIRAVWARLDTEHLLRDTFAHLQSAAHRMLETLGCDASWSGPQRDMLSRQLASVLVGATRTLFERPTHEDSVYASQQQFVNIVRELTINVVERLSPGERWDAASTMELET